MELAGVKKHICLVWLICLAAALYGADGDVEWYISNSAGMALERANRFRALREKNALAVRYARPHDIPFEIRKYYSSPWRITCSVLYEDGKRVRTRWVFSDQEQAALFVAAIDDNGSGFIEWYDDRGLLVEEQRLDADGSGYFISYYYKDGMLLKAECRLVDVAAALTDKTEEAPAEEDGEAGIAGGLDEVVSGSALQGEDYDDIAGLLLSESGLYEAEEDVPADPPARSAADMARNPDGPAPVPEFFVAAAGREGGAAWTDSYRYTRSKSLRSIRRVFHNHDDTATLSRFPRFVETGQDDTGFVDTPAPYVSLFLSDIMRTVPAKADYAFDSKRRVVTQTYRDEEDAVIGELKNTWEGDRLASVSWTAPGDDELLVVYVYDDSGNRVKEENYR
ncbi:MAG: hypothetical protein LBH50_06375, partial [Spirochaetaceae bacterium]|nr:hypothetical protein [Spirochaetaceae bacterium]